MKETFLKNSEGKVVLMALPSVGMNHSASFELGHENQGKCFPKIHPSDLNDNNVWTELSASIK